MKDARGTQIISDNRTQNTFFRREVTLTRDASIDTENENVKLKMTTTNPLYLPCVEPFPGTIQPLSHSGVTSLLPSRPPWDLVVLSWQFRINFSRDKALHLTVGLPKSSCVCGYGWLPYTVYIFISVPQSFRRRLVTYNNFFICSPYLYVRVP